MVLKYSPNNSLWYFGLTISNSKDGRCYTAKEAMMLTNQFVCDNKYSEISTFMVVSCTVNNGGCDKAKCVSDEFDNKIGCSYY
jgi:hypothetical protein